MISSPKALAVGLVLLVFLAGNSFGSDTTTLKPLALRCEYRQNPQGIDETCPRLNWCVESEERGQKQTAFQILVASSPEMLAHDEGDLWDSGKVESSQTTHIEYDGKPLESRRHCFWKVKSWDRDGVTSSWSKPASWSMGLLEDSDWSAKYISYRDETPIHKDRKTLFLPPARQYRKEFVAEKKVKRVTLYATALGIYELELNGQRVGDAHFAPGWTNYRQRAYYNTYDVTDLVGEGANALGASVADGWYSGYVGFGLIVGLGPEKSGRSMYGKTPALLVQLEIEYKDGSRQVVGTDRSWKVTGDGPIREADLLMGESYDARKEMPGWSEPAFDDSRWQAAILAEENGKQPATFYEYQNPKITKAEGGKPKVEGREVDLGFQRPKLEAFPGVPVRVTEETRPIKITYRSEGTAIFDMGQNFAGTIRIKLKGPAGHRITLRYGEMLHPDGRLMTENLRKARATDYYICKGDKQGEVYSPRFTSHGFQYVEVSNFPGEPDEETLTGLVLHSDTPLTSTFECSDPMVNQLFSNVVWTQRANFIDLPTDCPQRDERLGWTGDAQIYIGTATYNADVSAFFTKWLRELMQSQRPNGVFPGFAPFPFQGKWNFGTAWADAGVICPWAIWQAYGDTRIIERCWEPMTRFMAWRKKMSRENLGIDHGNDWGDWLSQGEETPLDYIDTVYFAITSKKMAQMAAAIGRDDEAATYCHQFAQIQSAFGKKYLKSDGSITVDTQTAYVLALAADLVPQKMRQATGQKLADRITHNGNRMATGFLGTGPILPMLSSAGQHDLATLLLQSREFPSWGYEIEQGATSIWERWDGFTKEDGFGQHNAAMNSYSHYAFGAVCEWMFRTLAGIESDGPGYVKITIRPTPPSLGSKGNNKPIDWVKASYDSIHGKIVSQWKIDHDGDGDGDRFLLDVTIPTNTTATVYVPATQAANVTESGKPLSEEKQIRVVAVEEDRVVLEVQSGSYHFESTSGIAPDVSMLKTSKQAALPANSKKAVIKKRPNILFVFTDDHAYQAISAYGSRINSTPNIDRIARAGMRFDRCYVPNSICGPCRAVILTGKYSHLNGFLRNGNRFDGGQQTFPKLLQQVGYQTSLIGKWHLASAPTGFDHWEVLVGQGTYYNPDMIRNGQKVQHKGYTTEVVTDLALDWLQNDRDKEKPFLLMYQHKAPHRPWDPSPKFLNKYDDQTIPEPPTLLENYANRGLAVKQQDMTIAETMNARDLKLTSPENLTPDQQKIWDDAYREKNEAFRKNPPKGDALVRWKYQRYIKDYLRCVDSVDEQLGRMLDWLDETGLAQNTVVIYCSDQGFYLGEHGWFDKRWMYEQSLRTPLLVRWPGVVSPGELNGAIVSPLDFAATFLEIADAPIPDDLQGKSLVPVLQGKTPSDWRTTFYYHYYEYPGYHYVRKHYGVTDGRFKLIHFYEPDVDEWELFDLLNDPNELQNVYDNQAYLAMRKRLKIELDRLREELQVPEKDPPASISQRGPKRGRQPSK